MFSPGDILFYLSGEVFVVISVYEENATMEVMIVESINSSEPDHYPVGYKFDVLQRVWSNHVKRGIVTHFRNGNPVPIFDFTTVMCG